jgi:CRISPR-associated protein Cas5d
MGILLKVSGRWACFSRPELKVETVSYDVITPTAARAILESIYWKPEIKWVVNGITVLNPIRTFSIKRNFISKIIGKRLEPIMVEDCREQRNATILQDVAYIIAAHFEIISGDKNSGKHMDMFTRRAEKGQCYRHPYFGCREFSVDKFELVSHTEPSALKGTMNLGYMLHSIDFATGFPSFFNAVVENGYMAVPLKGIQ